MSSISKISGYFSRHPQKLFLLDSIGAFLTACMLIVMLIFFRKYIGIDIEVFTLLISIAVLYSLYSFCCYKIHPEKWQIFLRIIAIANMVYAGGIMVFICLNYNYLALLGILYFSIEAVIIIGLAILELKVVKEFTDIKAHH